MAEVGTGEASPIIPKQGPDVKPEATGRSVNTQRGKLGRAAAAGLVGVGMALGAIGAASAETATPPPTKPAASGTPTPDVKGTQLAELRATVAENEKRNKDATATQIAEEKRDEEIAKLAATATAQGSPTKTPEPTQTPVPTETPTITPTGTPTETPTQTATPNVAATATEKDRIDEAVTKELADRREAKATRDEAARLQAAKLAPSATATKIPLERPPEALPEAPPEEPPVEDQRNVAEKAVKVAGGVGLLAAAGAGIGAFIRRIRRGRIPPP